jgi:two-component SAPR family response regulator
MDGFALAKWVRQHFPQVRILLASGVAEMGEHATGLCDGPFFDKPYSHEALETNIRQLVRLFGKRTG